MTNHKPKTTQRGQESVLTLSMTVDTDIDLKSPPKAFRLFREGMNKSTKGDFLFDEQSRHEVMSDYLKKNRWLSIDYDHASLMSNPVDPAMAARRAGKLQLEVTPEGDLMAVNVSWTPMAAKMLMEEEYGYISPAFTTDEDGRITSVINVAITNNPALYDLTELCSIKIQDGRTTGKTIVRNNSENKRSDKLMTTADITMNTNTTDSITDESGMIDELASQNEQLKAQLRARDKKDAEALILSAVREGKLDPKAGRSFALKMFETQGVEGVTEYLNTLKPASTSTGMGLNTALKASPVPARVVLTSSTDEQEQSESSEPQTVKLKDIAMGELEEVYASCLGISKKEWNKTKVGLKVVNANASVAGKVDIKCNMSIPVSKARIFHNSK